MSQEKRKLPRFHITPCQFHDQVQNKNFSVQDISKGGLAISLVDRRDLGHFAVSSVHTGAVKVEGRKITCSFQVKFIRGILIGGEWMDPSAELLGHLEAISKPEHLGLHLKKYDFPDLLDTTWYHNPVGVDFLLYSAIEDRQNLTRWILYIHHSFIQWDAETGVQTGQTLAEDDEGFAHGIVRLETRLIEYDDRPDRTLLSAASELIGHTSMDETELKKRVLAQINGGA